MQPPVLLIGYYHLPALRDTAHDDASEFIEFSPQGTNV